MPGTASRPSSNLPRIFQQTASPLRHFPSHSEPLFPIDCYSEGSLVSKNRRRTRKERTIGGRGTSFIFHCETSRHKGLTTSMYLGQVKSTDVLPDSVPLAVFDLYIVRKQETKRWRRGNRWYTYVDDGETLYLDHHFNSPESAVSLCTRNTCKRNLTCLAMPSKHQWISSVVALEHSNRVC